MNYMFTYRWLQNDRMDCAVLLPLTRGQTTSRVKLSLQFGGKTDMHLIKCNLVFKCFPSIDYQQETENGAAFLQGWGRFHSLHSRLPFRCALTMSCITTNIKNIYWKKIMMRVSEEFTCTICFMKSMHQEWALILVRNRKVGRESRVQPALHGGAHCATPKGLFRHRE